MTICYRSFSASLTIFYHLVQLLFIMKACLKTSRNGWSPMLLHPPICSRSIFSTISQGVPSPRSSWSKGSRCSEKDAVTDELKRIWGAHPVESVHRLSDRLPYIPIGNIWRVISGNDLFVLSSEGEYLFIDRFRITKDEEEDILDFVDEICEENGFASLCDVPLGSIEEENYELTQTAIYNAIYKKCCPANII